MGPLGGPAEIPVIRGFLDEPDPRVRGNAIEALLRLAGDEAIVDMARALKDRSSKVRQQARQALLEADRRRLVAILQEKLASDEAANRDLAAYALVKLELPETLPLMVGALSDAEMSIRLKARNALVTLAKQGCADATAALERLAGKRGTPDEFMTISVLERRPHLELLCDPRPRERMKGVECIVQTGDAARVPHLLQVLLVEKDPYVRATIVLALGRLGARDAVPTLKILTEDGDARIRANAVEALGALSGDDVSPFLLRCLDDGNNRVRANAVVALRDYRLVDLAVPLQAMIDHHEQLMRRSAIWAITELRRPALIPLLRPLLVDRVGKVQRQAADAVALLATEGFAEAQALHVRQV